jgi:hypothetical protein
MCEKIGKFVFKLNCLRRSRNELEIANFLVSVEIIALLDCMVTEV